MFPLLETVRGLSIQKVDKVSTFCNIVYMNKVDDRQFEETARLLRVLGHPMRLAMVEALNERPWCVCELAASLRLNKSAASKHLSQLKSVGVIEMERDGTQVNCTLVMSCVLEMLHCANRDMAFLEKLVERQESADGPHAGEAKPACCDASSCAPKKKEKL